MSTYEPIASQTLGSAAASVTFSSIPQGYTDLVLVTTANASANGYSKLYFNGVTTTTYSATHLYGTGSVAGSARQTTGSGLGYIQCHYLYTGSNQAILQINLQNYSNTTTFKSFLIKEKDATYEIQAKAGLWQSTSPITSLTLERVTGNWTSGSTFSIYGIQVGDKAQKAQGGNIVTTDGTYVYHTFTSSGSFIPSQALTVDYLVVAGGGAGGKGKSGVDYAGGGGAGGLRSTVTASGGTPGTVESALSVTAKSYPVIIGAGGAAGDTASKGNDSIFSTITSLGGGRGGGNGVDVNLDGGSGGGAGLYSGTNNPRLGGIGTANQGYNGGNGTVGSPYRSGGGGGAGAAGTTSNGGNGVAVSITGSSITYAGGGGGGASTSASAGTGGTGGGGAGSGSGVGANGTVSLGAGGGGGYEGSSSIGGNGGSGIVIIRYAI